MIVIWIVLGLVVLMGLAVFVGAPYVPSHRREVRRAFTNLRPLTNKDLVVDLGSGDGIVLRQAVALGAARAIGYEINPLLVWLSLVISARYRAAISVRTANMWHIDPPEGVTLVYVFGVGRDMRRLAVLLDRWATQAGRDIECIIYGHEVPNATLVRQEGAHRLYRFIPLQQEEAQV